MENYISHFYLYYSQLYLYYSHFYIFLFAPLSLLFASLSLLFAPLSQVIYKFLSYFFFLKMIAVNEHNKNRLFGQQNSFTEPGRMERQ